MESIESELDIPISRPEVMVELIGTRRWRIHEPNRIQHRRPVQEPSSHLLNAHSISRTILLAESVF